MTKKTVEEPSERARLEAILVAALVDNDDWVVLTELATAAGHGALARRFAEALADERRHLASVRAWAARETPSGSMRARARQRPMADHDRRDSESRLAT